MNLRVRLEPPQTTTAPPMVHILLILWLRKETAKLIELNLDVPLEEQAKRNVQQMEKIQARIL